MSGGAVATKSREAAPRSIPRAFPPWIALALILVLAALLAWREETSLDFGFHLATGRYILEHRAWPETDPFTYTVADHPYIDMHGLVQVAIALAERAGGLVGVGFLRAAFVLATTGVLYAHARRRGVRSPALLLLGFTLALFAWEQRFFARPEMATYLFLAIELYLLRRHAEDGRSRWLYAIPVLQVVWVSSHALSLFGPAVLGLYAVFSLAHARAADLGAVDRARTRVRRPLPQSLWPARRPLPLGTAHPAREHERICGIDQRAQLALRRGHPCAPLASSPSRPMRRSGCSP